jgi:hypothetical protein
VENLNIPPPTDLDAKHLAQEWFNGTIAGYSFLLGQAR